MPSEAYICDRTRVSDRAAASIASGALKGKTKTQWKFFNNWRDLINDFRWLFCHTQAVERTLNLVTKSTQNVRDSITREELIRAKIDSCEKMSKIDMKKTV